MIQNKYYMTALANELSQFGKVIDEANTKTRYFGKQRVVFWMMMDCKNMAFMGEKRYSKRAWWVTLKAKPIRSWSAPQMNPWQQERPSGNRRTRKCAPQTRCSVVTIGLRSQTNISA